MNPRFGSHPLAAVALAALALLATGARAATLYDNLGSSPVGSDPLYGYGPLADSFSTGASSATLGSVLLSLTSLSSAYDGSLSVQLRANAAGSPGAALATLGTLSFGAVSSATLGAYAFTPASTVVLSPLTRYWIELTGAGPNAIQWSWSDDIAAVGVAGEYSASALLGVNANSSLSGPYQMTVLTAPVPEPTTAVLTAVGLLTLWAGARARRGG